jgi:cation diffusion facilitator family transporter
MSCQQTADGAIAVVHEHDSVHDHDAMHEHEHPHDHHHDHPHAHDHGHGPLAWLKSIVAPHSHDAADSVDTALESNAAGVRAVKISLFVLLATACAQLVVVLVSGSVALLADTVHNFSDALTAVPLWIAFVLARRPASRRFSYGFGRAEDLAGLFVVAMIVLSAVVAGIESVRRFVDRQPITHPWIVLVAGVVGFVGNEWVALYRIRIGRRIGSAALVADGLHARTDGFTSLAVALGAIGVLLGFPLADPIIGVLITVAILAVLRGAVVEVFRRLLDGVDPVLADAAHRALSDQPGVEGIRRLRMRWDGHRLTADADIEVDPELALVQARSIAHAGEHRLLDRVPKLAVATVHAYPR